MSLLDKVLGRNSSHVSHKLKGAKHLPHESFEEYRQRLRQEEELLDSYLEGDLVWCSKAFKKQPFTVDGDGEPVYIMTVDRQISKGTYIKERDGIITSPRRTI